MHEETQASKSRQEIAENRSNLLERDLFEIRARIMDIIQEAERKHLGRKQRQKRKDH